MKRLLLLWLLLVLVAPPCFAQEPTALPKPAAPATPTAVPVTPTADDEKPPATEESATVKDPAKTQDPADTSKPASSQEPAATPEPTDAKEPKAGVSEPAVVEEPAAIEDPAIAQDPAAMRFKDFVATVSKSRRLVEIKSFFSQRMWKAAFLQASVTENAERQRSIVKDMTRSYAKYTITGAKAIGPRVELTVVTKDPEGQPIIQKIQMVQEGNLWVIDG